MSVSMGATDISGSAHRRIVRFDGGKFSNQSYKFWKIIKRLKQLLHYVSQKTARLVGTAYSGLVRIKNEEVSLFDALTIEQSD